MKKRKSTHTDRVLNMFLNPSVVFGMVKSYDSRKIDNTCINEYIVDTVYADDTGLYETAVKHPDINSGEWVIVEEYETKRAAISGHKKWVKECQNNIEKLFSVQLDCWMEKEEK